MELQYKMELENENITLIVLELRGYAGLIFILN